MCGIVGYAGKTNVIKNIMTGLKSLEYRGYDSSGIAYLDKNNNIKIYKKVGQIKNLDQILNYEDEASLGISHTRWATHGGVTDTNAHPHNQGKITLVHNGIIENYEELKKELEKEGYNFKSSTDSEVAAALIDKLYKENKDMLKTLVILKDKLKGSYAFNIINSDIPNKIYGIRKDVPLIVGVSDHGNMFASDIPAILHVTNKYIVLNNNEIVELEQDNIKYYNSEGKEITKEVKEYAGTIDSISKNGYDHFMLKEINEESEVVKNILNLYTKNNKIKDIYNIKKYKNIDIVACGSASFAGQIGKYYIEKYANIKTEVYYASEYRYQKNFFTKDTLVILISQSGETADTLAALKLAKENGINTLAIVNRRDSSIAREADSVIYTEAGIEVAVATTKAYLAQVLILLLLAFKDNNKETKLLEDLKLLPNLITKYINEYDYSNIANILKDKEHIFYLGRGIDYYLSMEGSLKLKEISYIHSEAFQAGELKHGSISLIDKDFGVVSVVTDKTISDKTISNLKEVSARGAKIITITNIKDNNFADYTILVEDYDEILNPLLVIVPMQMLAYNVAKLRDCDIDKPRNLAKSVTVE
ncbi:MAG: glutamine--fructose-6-phosphate transaminase (isomerizing) [Bacilli bacterium]|jgi:glucosamine--fructose-6-phosphate aminotransferase (isomerizing)|nr:glutamine--fructose-6-phosphate transaminase (isomerizing) [Bacilli bacterium]